MSKFGILGSGLVGQTLAIGLRDKGYSVKIGCRSARQAGGFTKSTGVANGTFADVARWADHLVLWSKAPAPSTPFATRASRTCMASW